MVKRFGRVSIFVGMGEIEDVGGLKTGCIECGMGVEMVYVEAEGGEELSGVFRIGKGWVVWEIMGE